MGAESITNICINMDDKDLENLKKIAENRRVPYSILARMFIIQGMKEVSPSS